MSETNTSLIVAGEEPVELAPVPDESLNKTIQNFAGINIGGDTVTRNTEHLPEEEKHLVRWLHTLARRNKWTWQQLTRETGIDRSVAWRIWNDKYRFPDFTNATETQDGREVKVKRAHARAGERISLAGVCAAIAKAKKLREERESIFSPGFLKTTIYDKIAWACDKALVRNKIVSIYGESQIGKTRCELEYARLHNGGQTTFVRVPPSAGVQLMTKHFARALHVSTAKAYEALIEDVVNALDKDKLLIIDELHEVFMTYQKTSVMRCLETIRYIYDQTNCGMVLSATNIFRDRQQEGEFQQFLKQLGRRILYTVQLPDEPPQEDLMLALEKYELPWPSGRQEDDFLHMAKEGFGIVLTRLTDGKDLAAKAGETYTWDHFTEAREIIRKMALTSKQIEEEAKSQKLKGRSSASQG